MSVFYGMTAGRESGGDNLGSEYKEKSRGRAQDPQCLESAGDSGGEEANTGN